MMPMMPIGCICGGFFEYFACASLLGLIGWLHRKWKQRCCCKCHDEHEHKETPKT